MASSSMGVGQALNAALSAGKRLGDTDRFEAWLKKAGLDDRGWFLKSRLRREFDSGVELGSRKRVEGYFVWESEPDVWRTNLDPISEFDSYGDAARFVRSWVKDRRKNIYRVPNPACGGTKPVELITDRAKRYRANHPECKPEGPRRCLFCGSRKNVDVHHLDGNESHGDPRNLAYACRKCNSAIGAAMAKKGAGKRTRQYNSKGRVPSYQEYVAAVAAHRRGAWDAGGKVIHATPPDIRREYAARIWERRRERGSVPF